MSNTSSNTPKASNTPKTVPVELLYDFWADEKRIAKGAKLELPLDVAKKLIETEKARRADPMPGE